MATKTKNPANSGNPATRAQATQGATSRPAPVNPTRWQLLRAQVFGKAQWRPRWAIALSIFTVVGLALAIVISIQLVIAGASSDGALSKMWLMVGNLVIISSLIPLANLVWFWLRGGRTQFWLGFLASAFVLAWCFESHIFPL